MFDLAIIGGGPAGYVAAERAGAKGLKVVLFEKKTMGGVCLNEGCIPTKTLLYSAKVYDTAKTADKYGVLCPQVDFNFGKMFDRKNKVVRKLVAGVQAKMKAYQVQVVVAEAVLDGRSAEGIRIQAAGEQYFSANVLLCTGSEAAVPPIPGLKEAGEIVLTNREILQLKEQPKRLVVIGGGVIGMEFASFFNSLGTEVTVIEMLPEILTGMDVKMSGMLREMYAKKGIVFNLQSKVTEIKANTVCYETDGTQYTVEGDRILLSVGRRANTTGLGLESLGIELYKGGIKVNERMETNVPNVFAAGDVTGFSLLAHTASREGEVVVHNLIGRKDTMRYTAIPAVVYTNPEIAGVGLTEEAAAQKGIPVKVSELPMAYAGRFVAENEMGNGLCKIIAGVQNGEILGVHFLGNPSSEMIYGACLAIEQEMTINAMEEVVFPHPTVSEIFKETLFAFS